ncbi:hypothetical protein C475_21364 [Halosimplex carlsbadense 2-9-1]|uniref:Uncharacterized protein n=1 Tax=Halosimplex carlsbadense 2-9-1 TaxID=797114 RepID=M0CDD8_9EURY|nr:hypothetical protein C475_21364 [Halosimplex carlsbadense 2-9-1]
MDDLVSWIAIPATHLSEPTMSLHETTGGRNPNRESNDSRRDANRNSGSDRDGGSEADGHRSPSNGGPNRAIPADAAPADSDTGEQVTAIAVDGRKSERADTEHRSAGAVLTETIVSAYTPATGQSSPEPDRAVIGMQSQMGRQSAERPSSGFCGAASDLFRLRSSSGDGTRDSAGRDPACAQPSGYLAPRR